MRTKIRSTQHIDEYWCTEEKRIISLPKGAVPEFEVVKNPPTMLVGVDLAKGNDRTVLVDEPLVVDMNMKELRAYAKEHDITIPFEVKKLDDVRKFIITYLDNPEGDTEDADK